MGKCSQIMFKLTWAALSNASFLFAPTFLSDKQAHLLWSQMLALKCVIEGLWLSYISPLMPLPCFELSSAMAECEVQGLIYTCPQGRWCHDMEIWFCHFLYSFSKFSNPFHVFSAPACILLVDYPLYIWAPDFCCWLGLSALMKTSFFAVSMLPVTTFGLFPAKYGMLGLMAEVFLTEIQNHQ